MLIISLYIVVYSLLIRSGVGEKLITLRLGSVLSLLPELCRQFFFFRLSVFTAVAKCACKKKDVHVWCLCNKIFRVIDHLIKWISESVITDILKATCTMFLSSSKPK